MMWLHGSDKFDADAIVKRWKSACERDQFILMVPRCSGDAWKIDDLDFVVRAHEQALIAYNIDPLRVAIDGHQIGGALACVFTFNDPDHIRGLAVVQSRVVAKTLPEADPEHRLSFYIAGSSKIENSEKIEELEKLKHPVVSRKLDDKASDLTDEQFAELLRWFDSLDRI
jgi:poly(3-hydroxybutyrate) depolymerase